MKAALIALVLATVAPAHVTLGPVVVPVPWLLVLGEVVTSAGVLWLAFQAARRFRSVPWLRPAFAGAAR